MKRPYEKHVPHTRTVQRTPRLYSEGGQNVQLGAAKECEVQLLTIQGPTFPVWVPVCLCVCVRLRVCVCMYDRVFGQPILSLREC